MVQTGQTLDEARLTLTQSGGFLRRALSAAGRQ